MTRTLPTNRKAASSASYAPDFGGFFPVGEAFSLLLHPHAEVVIHDLVNDRIAGIWNAFSKRKVGDASNLFNDPSLRSEDLVIGPYEKAERDGRRLKSISASLRDADGKRTGLLCVNVDMSRIDTAVEMLRAFANSGSTMPTVLFKGDLREQVNLIVRDYLLETNRGAQSITKSDRLEIVQRCESANIFEARNSVPLVAAALGIGRGNIYHMLRALRARRVPE